MGGRTRSKAKTLANRAKATAFWKAVRAGKAEPPRRPRVPPSPEQAAELLREYCSKNGIRRLEVFGSVARGTARRGSDVDLIATFRRTPGLRFFVMADEMAEILRVPVDLLDRESVDEMTNPYRKQSIMSDVRQILSL